MASTDILSAINYYSNKGSFLLQGRETKQFCETSSADLGKLLVDRFKDVGTEVNVRIDRARNGDIRIEWEPCPVPAVPAPTGDGLGAAFIWPSVADFFESNMRLLYMPKGSINISLEQMKAFKADNIGQLEDLFRDHFALYGRPVSVTTHMDSEGALYPTQSLKIKWGPEELDPSKIDYSKTAGSYRVSSELFAVITDNNLQSFLDIIVKNFRDAGHDVAIKTTRISNYGADNGLMISWEPGVPERPSNQLPIPDGSTGACETCRELVVWALNQWNHVPGGRDHQPMVKPYATIAITENGARGVCDICMDPIVFVGENWEHEHDQLVGYDHKSVYSLDRARPTDVEYMDDEATLEPGDPVVGTTGNEIDPDGVNHPSHYNSHPSGIECIQVIRYFGFNVGSAIKYLWRAGLKTTEGEALDMEIKDLKKAVFYLNDEIEKLEKRRDGR